MCLSGFLYVGFNGLSYRTGFMCEVFAWSWLAFFAAGAFVGCCPCIGPRIRGEEKVGLNCPWKMLIGCGISFDDPLVLGREGIRVSVVGIMVGTAHADTVPRVLVPFWMVKTWFWL
ncbi:uncharacterized protein F4822DRAFT_19903 [Hypoxylon trugodes]|uniref:uncharacterized protein n=1 Tax=Hypoxylon trugodes TaxID=326681 RepID=UPI0021973DAE|nr:uncharacterized protein F4822DRAFT_19903 [Hypoxylon trugodes]KAI1393645.1 hypothetical protein F4822DRAFT_19903 [Hypoxylon trugodes]